MNIQTKLHPSAGEKVGDFSDFMPFVALASKIVRDDFVDTLSRLYEETSRVWFPGACGSANWLVKIGNQLDIDGHRFKPVRYGFNHYLALLDTPYTSDLLVDPFGVPEVDADWRANPRLITPYFGELNLSPTANHLKVYSDLESGHRVFRP